MKPNPHDLINLPGYGNAEKELRKTGAWDDTKIIDGVSDLEFRVAVSGYYDPETETQCCTVVAKTKDEAMDKAEDMCDFDYIEDVEIKAVREITK